MGCGTGLMKTLMFVFNGIVWILGLVLFVVGVVVLVEGKNWNDIVDNKTVPVSVMLIVVGLVIAVVGFLGCCGAMKQNGSMLLVYAIILGLIIILQCVAGILAFIFSDEAHELVQTGLEKGLTDYGKPPSVDVQKDEESIWTTGIDWVQEKFECCGITDGYDWSEAAGAATWWISKTGGKHVKDVPDSCCTTITANCGAGKAVKAVQTGIHEAGCFKEAKEWVEDQSMIMGILGIVFMVLEAFNIVFALVLRRSSSA